VPRKDKVFLPLTPAISPFQCSTVDFFPPVKGPLVHHACQINVYKTCNAVYLNKKNERFVNFFFSFFSFPSLSRRARNRYSEVPIYSVGRLPSEFDFFPFSGTSRSDGSNPGFSPSPPHCPSAVTMTFPRGSLENSFRPSFFFFFPIFPRTLILVLRCSRRPRFIGPLFPLIFLYAEKARPKFFSQRFPTGHSFSTLGFATSFLGVFIYRLKFADPYGPCPSLLCSIL